MPLRETPIQSGFLGLTKRANCPSCGTKLTKRMGTSRSLCSRCGDYSAFTPTTLRQLDPATVEAQPSFAVPLPWTLWAPTSTGVMHPIAALTDMIRNKKEGARIVDATWPEGCCVCGKPATRQETISLHILFTPPSKGIISSGRQTETTVVAAGVPHCADHKNGAEFKPVLSFGDLDLMVLGLFLRSYAYQIEFRKLNPWKWSL